LELFYVTIVKNFACSIACFGKLQRSGKQKGTLMFLAEGVN
jgi:hypothetical protein